MALFDDNKDNKEKGNNISKRIEKDIKKKKNYKNVGRGKTKNTKINHEKKETITERVAKAVVEYIDSGKDPNIKKASEYPDVVQDALEEIKIIN